MRFVNQPKNIDGIEVIQDPIEMEEALKNGKQFYHWESGDSLSPLINNMEYCLIKPCAPRDIKRGDCIFCVIQDASGFSHPMVHQVWEISDASHSNELWFKIGDTHTTVFGWTKEVYGVAKGTNIYQELTPQIVEIFKQNQEKNI